MPEKAKVFIAEDDKTWRKFVKDSLVKSNHTVVIEAEDVEQALGAVPLAVELRVNVAVLDGSIPNDMYDGEIIAAALRKVIPGIKVVGVSGRGVTGADVNIWKGDFYKTNLGQIVKDL